MTQKVGQMRYTTNWAVVLVNEKPASDLKVAMATDIPKVVRHRSRRNCGGKLEWF